MQIQCVLFFHFNCKVQIIQCQAITRTRVMTAKREDVWVCISLRFYVSEARVWVIGSNPFEVILSAPYINISPIVSSLDHLFSPCMRLKAMVSFSSNTAPPASCALFHSFVASVACCFGLWALGFVVCRIVFHLSPLLFNCLFYFVLFKWLNPKYVNN